jgi:hypothetical protein
VCAAVYALTALLAWAALSRLLIPSDTELRSAIFAAYVAASGWAGSALLLRLLLLQRLDASVAFAKYVPFNTINVLIV